MLSELLILEKINDDQMITCVIKYIIDPDKVDEFEEYGKRWMPLVEKFGGVHLGYFLPHEGANNVAYALFNFTSLSAYENYRQESLKDVECIQLYEFAKQAKCIVSYERSFLKPMVTV